MQFSFKSHICLWRHEDNTTTKPLDTQTGHTENKSEDELRNSTHLEIIRYSSNATLRLKCDGTSPETGFRLSAVWTSPFKSAGASVQSTAGSRGVRISGSNAGYTMFRGSVKSTG
jgi:hypothetical protein